MAVQRSVVRLLLLIQFIFKCHGQYEYSEIETVNYFYPVNTAGK